MKIKIQISNEKTSVLLLDHEVEINQDGDISREIAYAANLAWRNGIEPFGWTLRLVKTEE